MAWRIGIASALLSSIACSTFVLSDELSAAKKLDCHGAYSAIKKVFKEHGLETGSISPILAKAVDEFIGPASSTLNISGDNISFASFDNPELSLGYRIDTRDANGTTITLAPIKEGRTGLAGVRVILQNRHGAYGAFDIDQSDYAYYVRLRAEQLADQRGARNAANRGPAPRVSVTLENPGRTPSQNYNMSLAQVLTRQALIASSGREPAALPPVITLSSLDRLNQLALADRHRGADAERGISFHVGDWQTNGVVKMTYFPSFAQQGVVSAPDTGMIRLEIASLTTPSNKLLGQIEEQIQDAAGELMAGNPDMRHVIVTVSNVSQERPAVQSLLRDAGYRTEDVRQDRGPRTWQTTINRPGLEPAPIAEAPKDPFEQSGLDEKHRDLFNTILAGNATREPIVYQHPQINNSSISISLNPQVINGHETISVDVATQASQYAGASQHAQLYNEVLHVMRKAMDARATQLGEVRESRLRFSNVRDRNLWNALRTGGFTNISDRQYDEFSSYAANSTSADSQYRVVASPN